MIPYQQRPRTSLIAAVEQFPETDNNFKGPFYTLRHIRKRPTRDTGELERGPGSPGVSDGGVLQAQIEAAAHELDRLLAPHPDSEATSCASKQNCTE